MNNIMHGVTANLTGLTNLSSVYWPFNKDEVVNTMSKLSDSKLINKANEINSILNDTHIDGYKNNVDLTLPILVVVGSQSAGKSSVLNNITGKKILPTGQLMTTRTPMEMHMHKINKGLQEYIEFGEYSREKSWVVEKKILLDTPIPQTSQIDQIREHIAAKTIEICGPGMNISSRPIIFKLYSPFVPNLSLVDLPGLTMVACEDKGQPANIKELIENLIGSYIENKKSIIIAVMQARPDIEADIGLAFVKKYDNNGERTIGVLTKPDLMNADNHVGDYLINSNKISKNLMLNHGYYLLKNCNDRNAMDIVQGFKAEAEYFASHPEYKKAIYKNKVGITNLSNNLTKILVASIKETIPTVMTGIIALETNITNLLAKMGDDLPCSKEGKLSILNKYITSFNTKFVDSIESRGNPVFNTGKTIKDIMISFRENVMQIKPFDNDAIYNDAYFNSVKSSFEGNHMSYYTPPIQILESCMTDPNYRPCLLLKNPATKCVDQISSVIIDLIRSILAMDEFSQYPPLASFIMTNLVDHIISQKKMSANEVIMHNIQIQEAYIWTENAQFKESLKEITREPNFKTESLRKFLESYYQSIKLTLSDVVPKIIMFHMIRFMEENIPIYLLENMGKEDKIELLKEDPNVDKQRKYYQDIKNRINNVKSSLFKDMSNDV